MQQEFVFLSSDDPELQRAWQTFPDPVMASRYGEVLEYMGSTYLPVAGWAHEFRHRDHPETHRRTYWQILAPEGWSPGAQERSI